MPDALLHEVAGNALHDLRGRTVAIALCSGLVACAAGPAPSEPTPVVPVATALRPLVEERPATTASPRGERKPTPIAWVDREAGERALEKGRRVMLYVRADWSVTSRVMERSVWSDEAVWQAAAGLVCVRADVTETTDDNEKLAARYDVRTVPTVLVLGADDEELARLEGTITVLMLAGALRIED